MSIEWDRYYEHANAEIERIFNRGFALRQAPTRSETIIEAWKTARLEWPRVATEFGMISVHDLDIIEPMHFEQIRYGTELVIECEGVVVERIAIPNSNK